MIRTGKWAVLCALALTMTTGQAQACWTKSEQDAAKVANLNMMMMVSALRCRKGPDDFLNEYNRFVKNNNPVIGAQNAAVRSHFVRMQGTGGADAAMDKFVIGIANNYGGGHDSLGCTQLKNIATDLARPGQSASSLLAIAERNIDEIPLSGGACPVSIAAK